MDIHQIRDGRIVVTWHLEDFAGLMAQLSAPTDAPVKAAWSSSCRRDERRRSGVTA